MLKREKPSIAPKADYLACILPIAQPFVGAVIGGAGSGNCPLESIV